MARGEDRVLVHQNSPADVGEVGAGPAELEADGPGPGAHLGIVSPHDAGPRDDVQERALPAPCQTQQPVNIARTGKQSFWGAGSILGGGLIFFLFFLLNLQRYLLWGI